MLTYKATAVFVGERNRLPYKIEGKTVVKKNSGKVVGHSKNPKKYIQVLNMVEHGVKPRGQVLGK